MNAPFTAQSLASVERENRDNAARLQAQFEEIRRLREEVHRWHRDAKRLAGGLIAIHEAAETVPAAVLRSVAYDVALNCMDGETAAFQIERRSAVRSSDALTQLHDALRGETEAAADETPDA